MRKIQTKFTRTIKELNEGKIKYDPIDEKPVDFRSYTDAQINEIKDYINLTRELVNEVERRIGSIVNTTDVGRPSKNKFDIAKAVLLQQFFEVSNRTAEGLADLFKEKLALTEHVTYQDIGRAYEDSDVALIIKTVFDITNETVEEKEHEFSIDGTGMPTTVKENYANDKEKKSFNMLMLMNGIRYKLISAFDSDTGPLNESPYLKPLLEETNSKYDSISLVCADAAYISKDNCNAIAAIGAMPRIYPKENLRINKRGSLSWKLMLTEFTDDVQSWLRQYHKRSISESVNSVLKNRFTRPLLKRLDDRRKAEICFRVACYNIRRLGYIHHMTDVYVKWLRYSS